MGIERSKPEITPALIEAANPSGLPTAKASSPTRNAPEFVEDVSGSKAVVHGNSAFILKNASRNGCHTFDALSLNVDYGTAGSEPEELSYVTVEKTTEEKTFSVILPVKRLGVSASTILTNLSGTGSLFSIGYSEQRGVFVEIRDNGVGFNVQATQDTYDQRTSLGLINMDERAELVGGHCTIESAKGKGTAIGVEIPFKRPVDIT